MIRGDFLLMMIEDRRRAALWTPPGTPGRTALLHSGVPLFQGVGRRHLRKIVQLISVEEYGDGVRVVRAGAKGEAFHIVLEGQALVELPGGDEIVLKPGDAFGELALIDGEPRSATVVASRGLCTGRIKRADFRRLLRDEPAVAVGLLPGLVGVVRYLEGDTGPQGTSPAAKPAPAGGPADVAEEEVAGRALLGWMPVLRHVPLFAPLPEGHLHRVAKLFSVRRFKDGSVIVREGEPGDSFYVLLEGRAKVERAGVRTHELEPGQWFGELALIDGAPRAATVRACDLTTLARLPRSAFQRLLKDEPRIALGLVNSLVALIRELQSQQ